MGTQNCTVSSAGAGLGVAGEYLKRQEAKVAVSCGLLAIGNCFWFPERRTTKNERRDWRLKILKPEMRTAGRWLSVDPHVHSIYSGGSLTPLEILNSAGRALLDAVAISDHHEVRGAIEGQIIAGTAPFLPLVVAAQEVSAGEHCHFLLIGSTKAQPELNRSRLGATLQMHRQSGGAVILAHPWTALKNSWFKGLLRELVTAGLVDGLELGNSALFEQERGNTSGVRTIWDEWVLPYQLAVTGGSDYHYTGRNRVIGGGRTYLKVTAPGETGIIEALRARRAVAGLFGPSELNLPGLASGNKIFLGQEPWHGEIMRLNANLQRTLMDKRRFNPKIARILWQLVEAGHFQAARELLGK
jgi:hypothetical protein